MTIVREEVQELPRYISDAVNHTVHTSSINGNERPVTLAFVAVKAALEAQRKRGLPEIIRQLEWLRVNMPELAGIDVDLAIVHLNRAERWVKEGL